MVRVEAMTGGQGTIRRMSKEQPQPASQSTGREADVAKGKEGTPVARGEGALYYLVLRKACGSGMKKVRRSGSGAGGCAGDQACSTCCVTKAKTSGSVEWEATTTRDVVGERGVVGDELRRGMEEVRMTVECEDGCVGGLVLDVIGDVTGVRCGGRTGEGR
jgi:hypothetical protein